MTRTWRTRLQLVGGVLLILLALWIVVQGGAEGTKGAPSSTPPSTPAATSTPDSGLETVAESALPPQGRETLELVRSGGPFPYARDGITFSNREGILPSQRRGYYREYTVPTPDEDDRGARRIVGGERGDRYYTDDHYDSFRQIEEGR